MVDASDGEGSMRSRCSHGTPLATEEEEEGDHAMAGSSALAPVEWPKPADLTLDWVLALGATLDAASRSLKPQELPSVVSVPVADAIIAAASKILHREPNCLRVDPDPSCNVVLVGDVHGQLHDVLHLLEISGYPGVNQIYVFNGDYVDRGAWGFETYLLLLAWKILLPHRVFLLRGNHETKFCTSAYGFENEIRTKYGDQAKHLYRKILGCFEGHPLAAVIAGSVYMAHGGLFRRHEPTITKRGKGGKLPKRLVGNEKGLTLGTLEDLAKARRGVLDPSGVGSNVIPGDVLWSDPAPMAGLTHNVARGIGLLFGPDCTEEFMDKHKLKLIVRSHEGPDAREKRDDMAGMEKGYTIDHVVKSGKLITLFSAPDYPQFQAGSVRYNNKGAYIVLQPPDFCTPKFEVFGAVKTRPQVSPYYDYLTVADSDEDLDLSFESDYSGSSELH